MTYCLSVQLSTRNEPPSALNLISDCVYGGEYLPPPSSPPEAFNYFVSAPKALLLPSHTSKRSVIIGLASANPVNRDAGFTGFLGGIMGVKHRRRNKIKIQNKLQGGVKKTIQPRVLTHAEVVT